MSSFFTLFYGFVSFFYKNKLDYEMIQSTLHEGMAFSNGQTCADPPGNTRQRYVAWRFYGGFLYAFPLDNIIFSEMQILFYSYSKCSTLGSNRCSIFIEALTADDGYDDQ